MKPQKGIIVLYATYILLISFSIIYYSYQNNITHISNYSINNNESNFVAVMNAFGSAFEETTNSVSKLAGYMIQLIISNILFFAVLKFIKRFSFSDLLYLISITHALAFILFLLIIAITQWSFNEYFTTAIPLLIATVYMSFETGVFNNKLIAQG